MSSRLPVLLAAALLSSCASVVHVKQDQADVSGIPFYIKTEQFWQTTTRRESWYRLTLKVEKKLVETKDGKEVLLDRGAQSFVEETQDLNDPRITAIKSAILAADSSNVAHAQQLIKDFQDIPPRNGALNATVLKNAIESEWIVDSTKKYFLNAPLPWFGTGSLTQKLNADATLAEVTASADTKVAEGISTLLPLKEFVSGKFIEPAPAANADSSKVSDVQHGLSMFRSQGGSGDLKTKQYVFIVSLSTDEVGYDVTYRRGPAATRPTLGDALTAGAGISEVKKALAAKEDEEKDDSPTIGITGSIKLPMVKE